MAAKIAPRGWQGSHAVPVQDTFVRSSYTMVQPSGGQTATAGTTITFNLPASTDFTDLAGSFMVFTGTPTFAGGAATSALDASGYPPITLANGAGDLLWSAAQLQVNSSVIRDDVSSFAGVASILRRCIEMPRSWAGAAAGLACRTTLTAVDTLPIVAAQTLQTVMGTSAGGEGGQFGFYLQDGDNVQTAATSAAGLRIGGSCVGADVRSDAQVSGLFSETATARAAAMGFPVCGGAGNFTTKQVCLKSWPSAAFSSLSDLIPPGPTMTLQFTRAPSDNILFVGSVAASFAAPQVVLFLRRVTVSSDAYSFYKEHLLLAPYRISFKRCQLTQLSLAALSTSVNGSSLLAGRKPNLVILMLTSTAAITGSSVTNAVTATAPDGQLVANNIPYFSQLQVNWAGQLVPAQAYNCMTNEFDRFRAYHDYVAVCDQGPGSVFLSWEQWMNNLQIYCFDLRAANNSEIGPVGSLLPAGDQAFGSLSITGSMTACVLPLTLVVMGIGAGELIIDSEGSTATSGY